MKHLTPALTALLLAAAVQGAAAQPPETGSSLPGVPRVEFGGGFTGAVPYVSDVAGTTFIPMGNARVGFGLSDRWSLEGAFDFRSVSDGFATVYRAQAVYRLGGHSKPGTLRTHVTIGGAGSVERRTFPGYSWQDASGPLYAYPAHTYWSASLPMYPTAGFGLQKTLGPHIAIRGDIAAIIVPYDDGISVLLMPSVSVSVPLGRYPVRRR
jgi:hypothetical protein